MLLQTATSPVDQSCAMGSTSRSTQPDTASAPSTPERHAITLEQFAHELNSLLDGSIRCVGLARRMLDQRDQAEPPSVTNALHKLNLAQENMRHMAAVLSRAMRSKTNAVDLLNRPRTIADTIDRIHQSLYPMARQAKVTISIEIDPAAGSLPTGPLEPVLLNGLRNAIEACVITDHATRRVDVSLSVNNEHDLVIFITDNGHGLADEAPIGTTTKPGGHGIGLELSRGIVEALGGALNVVNVPFGRGAVFQARVPVDKLSAS